MSESTGQQVAYGDAMDAFPSWVSLERALGITVSGSWPRGRNPEDRDGQRVDLRERPVDVTVFQQQTKRRNPPQKRGPNRSGV
jgi:hypothetical protein